MSTTRTAASVHPTAVRAARTSCAVGVAPRLALALVLAVSLLGGFGCRDSQPQPSKHLVLITADTWRGDHVLSERAGRALTPELERFAAGAIHFANATSVGTETSPGVAGLLTGLFPHRSGVIQNLHILPATVPTLASRLRAAGFATAAWVANPVVRAGFGFEQGFDTYEFITKRPPCEKGRADELVNRALAWLDEHPEKLRFFLWLHFMEPHGPYSPPPESSALFPSEAFRGPHEVPVLPEGDHSGRGGVPWYQWRCFPEPPRDGRGYLARYAAEVHSFDRAVGRLFARLEREDLLRESVVIVSSDHGEALVNDNGFYFSHANDLTEDQLHVPLLLHFPGCEAGSIVERPVSITDVLPTALALLGLPPAEDVDGTELLGARQSVVMSETRNEVALREGAWKLRWHKGNDAAVELVELRAGSSQEVRRTENAAERAAILEERLRKLQSREPRAPSISRAGLSELRRRELEALGYLQ